jgi:hypothetical protein
LTAASAASETRIFTKPMSLGTAGHSKDPSFGVDATISFVWAGSAKLSLAYSILMFCIPPPLVHMICWVEPTTHSSVPLLGESTWTQPWIRKLSFEVSNTVVSPTSVILTFISVPAGAGMGHA